MYCSPMSSKKLRASLTCLFHSSPNKINFLIVHPRGCSYLRMLMAHLRVGYSMSDDSVWSRLGVPYVVPFDELDKLKTLMHQMQVELLTTIEALSVRLATVEGKMSILEKDMDRKSASGNVFDFVSREELGIDNVSLLETPPQEYITESDTDEIRYIDTGFAAPPPEEEIIFDAIEDDELEEEVMLSTPLSWASNIVDNIKSNGGSVNQYWKRFGLIPKEISPADKTQMLAELKQMMVTQGISKYNVNRMRHFYYFGTPEEGEEKYNAFIN